MIMVMLTKMIATTTMTTNDGDNTYIHAVCGLPVHACVPVADSACTKGYPAAYGGGEERGNAWLTPNGCQTEPPWCYETGCEVCERFRNAELANPSCTCIHAYVVACAHEPRSRYQASSSYRLTAPTLG